MKLRIFHSTVATSFLIAPAMSCFAQDFQTPVLPTAGACFVYSSSVDGGNARENTICATKTTDKEVEFDNGIAYDATNFNEVKHPRRSFLVKDGFFGSKPGGCWPVAQICGVNAYPLKDRTFQLEGQGLQVGSWQAWFYQFNVSTKVIDCQVLGKEEKCLESAVKARDRANNGATHDTDAKRVFVLTGEAKGFPFEISSVSNPPGRLSVNKLIRKS
ncbi:MAG: hypothetical protein RJB34_1851 [Pseudomonadota bacterium]|jgi:hypothetical protein